MFAELDVSSVDSDMVYIANMVLILGCYMLVSGTLSVFARYIFVEYLYTGIKGD